ncbi:hypothetical protein FGG08_006318 [Glutinoglossum americanum]|uniref:RNA helicase n=1 Tax=Glutinoglossum americanum TaxID=1670608 RepID=A0A9P8L0I6_9PEZI|nr:hypothetical protein FGG08_006318 [Glutinoglossum americanum]
MVKKGSSSGSGKKPSATPHVPDADSSYIVFTNSKGKSKEGSRDKSNASTKPGLVDATNGSAGAASNAAAELPKKPDTRTLIGGASWTGKLPVNLLSEHCQKQKWERPEYTMRRSSEGHTSTVILKFINPKTKETTSLPPLMLPPTHIGLSFQQTAVEARHFAATYALFRVCSMRNIHMMLPPKFRDLWKGEFQELKEQDVKEGRGWMYEADPFTARRERDDAKAIMARKRAETEKREANLAQAPGGLGVVIGQSKPNINQKGNGNNVLRGWTRVPKIEMGKRTRAQIEGLIREGVIWNPNGIQMPLQVQSRVVGELSELGFRRSHVEEAVLECKDREETLEWLLIHVPEDDLPNWSLPDGYVAGISMVSGNLRREGIVNRLSLAGYAKELCETTLDANAGDEARAAEALQQILLLGEQKEPDPEAVSASAQGIWEEERATLEAIYDDRYTPLTPDAYEIQLDVRDMPQKIRLQVRKPCTQFYPRTVPSLSLISEPQLPAYIRLSCIRKSVEHAETNLLGEQMVFSIVDWLELQLVNIIERPGRLRDVSSATSTASELRPRDNTWRGKQGKGKYTRPIDRRPSTDLSLAILVNWEARQSTPAQEKMLAGRRSLPAWAMRGDIIQTVNKHQVTIISGETGSGKSTQSVQFILDDMIQRKIGGSANIICTQPRRISALGLADRVSDERCQRVGTEVGYAIRGESRQTPGTTRITFVTTGVLLRRLQTSGGSSDDVLAALTDVSHIVVDEVHERSLDTDFLLVLLRDVLKRRKDLKVVLMSATLDAKVFEDYFGGNSRVGLVNIEGRTFPVQDLYLDDIIRQLGPSQGKGHGEEYSEENIGMAVQSIGQRINYDLIANTVKLIDTGLGSQEGGILIFLPGTMEISKTLDTIRAIPNIHALPLHASLQSAEQRRVFPPAPKGKRKVIAATNVAETSITIEDIVAVIDTGRVKETSFDPQNNMVKLEEVWASRAACKQRRGRAGRVRAGKCYKLYTSNAEMSKMVERPEPEIRRVPLEQLCLSVKAMGVKDVPSFLASALTPPASTAVEGAMELLGRIGALDGEELTALGRHLAMIPADLRCGKLMVYGATFGCLEACLTIAAILTVKSPFVSPMSKRDESKAARSSFTRGHGDLLADLHAYEEWSSLRQNSSQRDIRNWCDQKYLSHQTLIDISSNRSQYLSSLKDIGFLTFTYHTSDPSSQGSYNTHNSNEALLRALIAGAFNPQTARIEFPEKKFAPSVSGAVELDPEARTIKYFNRENGRVFVHPSSTIFDAQGFPGQAAFVSYFGKMATSKVFIRDLTREYFPGALVVWVQLICRKAFNAYTLLLFSGPISLDTLGRGLVIDGWLRLRGWARIGVLVSRLRMMLDEVLARKIDDPGIDLGNDRVVGIVRKLVELDGLDQ